LGALRQLANLHYLKQLALKAATSLDLWAVVRQQVAKPLRGTAEQPGHGLLGALHHLEDLGVIASHSCFCLHGMLACRVGLLLTQAVMSLNPGAG
jgi:hypothetical protein